MRKRILASLLAAVMLFSLLPASALAVQEDEADSGTAVVCTETEDCAAEAHSESCPLYAVPGEDDPESVYDVDEDTTVIDPDQEEVPAEPTAEEQLAELIAALPDPEDIDPTDEEQVEAVYEQIAEIYAFAEENGLDVEDNETVNAVIDALYPKELLDETTVAATSGNCGAPVDATGEYSNSVTWSFADGVLTISGSGDMADFENFTDTDGSYVSKSEYEESGQYDSKKLIYYAGTTTYVSDTPWKDLGTTVKSVVISEGVTHIGMRAFRLPSVESVTIAHSVTSIGSMAFDSEPLLTTVTWVGDWSLSGHDKMKFDGFGNCFKLGESQEFSEWLPDCFASMNGQAINGSAFSINFEKLNAQLTDQTDGYGNSAFQNMPNLKSATLDENFGTNAFSGSGIETLTISSDLTSIPNYTCENCESLTSVVIPSGVTSIGAAAFRGSGLTSLTFEGSSAVTFGNQSFVTKDGSGPALSTLTLSENMSISDGSAIVNYLTGVGAVTDSTTITPSKFADALTEELTVDGSLGAEITRENYPNVTKLTITGDSYTSAVSAFSIASGGTGKLKTLEINVTGTATINATAFIREALESVKISASELKLTGDAAFLNNSALSHIDLTGVKTITTGSGAGRTFLIDGNSTASNLERYVYLNDAACYQAIQSHLGVDSDKGTSTCLITNGGTLTGNDGTFSTVTKEGYTATWYVYSQSETDYHGTQVTNSNDTPTKGSTYIVEWTLDSDNYVEVTYKDGYTDDSGITEAVAKSSGTLAGADTFTRTGYTLTGWKVDSGDDTYELGETVSPTSSMTLVAQWTLNKPTVTGSTNKTYDGQAITLTASHPCADATYQWKKNGTAIADECGKTLTLTGNVSDSGNYTCAVSVGDDMAVSDETTVNISKAAYNMSGVSFEDATYIYDGTEKALTISGTLPDGVSVSYSDNTLTNVGSTNATASFTGDSTNYEAISNMTATLTITAAGSSVSITANGETSLEKTGSCTVTLAVSGVPDGGAVTVVQTDNQGSDAKTLSLTGNGSVSVSLSNTTAKYTFTVSYAGDDNHSAQTASCTVSVTKSGGSSSGGGSSSSSSTTTETTTNSDGSTTTTVTNKTTGTVTETTKYTDGSSLVVVTEEDGTVTTTETTVDKVVVKTVDEPGEDVTATVTIPRSVGTTTVTIPADTTSGTVAVDADTGEVVKLSVPTDDGMLVKLDGSASLVLVDMSKDFTDTDGHWAEDAIDFATAHGMFNGTSATTFTPDGTMTRGMIAVVLHNLEDNPDHAFEGSFDDVHPDSWYADAIHWMVDNGIGGGYGNGKFGADDNITREQLATFLYRYAGAMGYGTSGGSSLSAFTDAGSVSSYAAEAMQWAVGNGLFGGMGDGTLAPQGNATRAQVATILMRFIENLTK